MGLFGSSKPRVTHDEFADIRSRLSSRGFSERQIKDIRMIFHGALDESEKDKRGIDAREIEAGILWMKDNMRIHSVSEEKIQMLKELLEEEL